VLKTVSVTRCFGEVLRAEWLELKCLVLLLERWVFVNVPATQYLLYTGLHVIWALMQCQWSSVVLCCVQIVISLVNNRPSANNFSYSDTLQQWTRATNVRLRLLRTKTLLGHLMAVARQDPTVTRRVCLSVSLSCCNKHLPAPDVPRPVGLWLTVSHSTWLSDCDCDCACQIILCLSYLQCPIPVLLQKSSIVSWKL